MTHTTDTVSTGEVIDTIRRSLVASEMLNNTDTWHKRMITAIKWLDELAATIATQAARIAELEKQVAWKEGLIRQLTEVDMPALEADNERLRAELAVVQDWKAGFDEVRATDKKGNA